MSSERQIEANKQNAKSSAGPRSPEGKARVAGNALKHGLTGRRIVLPNEDPHEFEAFRNDLWNDLEPKGIIQAVLVEKIVTDAWRIMRISTLEVAMHTRDNLTLEGDEIRSEISSYYAKSDPMAMFEKVKLDPAYREACSSAQARLKEASLKLEEPTMKVMRVMQMHGEGLDRLWRYEEALTRSLLRTLHELQRLQAIRAGERVPPPAAVDVDVNINGNGLVNPK